MPRTAKQNQVIRDKRKAKITAEGIKLISQKGLKEVVIDDIAKEVGCSHGLFYHYYKRTEDLYAAIPDFIHSSKKVEPFCKLYAPLRDAKGKEGIELLAKNFEDLPNYPELLLHLMHVVFESRESLSFFKRSDGQPMLKIFEDLVRHGQKEGVVKDGKVDELIDLLLDTLNGYIARVLKEGKNAKPLKAELFAKILLK